MVSIGGMNVAVSAATLTNVVMWLGIGLLMLFVLIGVFFIFHMLSYSYKITIWPLVGSGNKDEYTIGQPKTNKIKFTKDRTTWKKLWPLFNSKRLQPFDGQHIYPGKRIYAYELDGEYIPAKINIAAPVYKKDENGNKVLVSAEVMKINPVPAHIRLWQMQEHRRNAQEFAQQGFWEQNKQILLTLGVAIACLACVGLTVYFTYKFTTGGVAATDRLTSAIKGLGNIPGVAP